MAEDRFVPKDYITALSSLIHMIQLSSEVRLKYTTKVTYRPILWYEQQPTKIALDAACPGYLFGSSHPYHVNIFKLPNQSVVEGLCSNYDIKTIILATARCRLQSKILQGKNALGLTTYCLMCGNDPTYRDAFSAPTKEIDFIK